MTCIKDERIGYLLDPLAFEVFDEEVFPDGQVDEVVVCESGSQHSEGPVEGASLEDPEADPSPLDPPPPLQELEVKGYQYPFYISFAFPPFSLLSCTNLR